MAEAPSNHYIIVGSYLKLDFFVDDHVFAGGWSIAISRRSLESSEVDIDAQNADYIKRKTH